MTNKDREGNPAMSVTVSGAGSGCLPCEVISAIEKEALAIYEAVRADWLRLAQAHGKITLAPSQLPSHRHRSLKGF